MLCSSILQNRGQLTADKTIRYNPEKSILKIQLGHKIQLTEPDFSRFFKAFFAELEAKLGER